MATEVPRVDDALAAAGALPRRGQAIQRALRRPQFWFGAAVLVPLIIWYVLFAFVPILRGLWLAVVEYDVMNPSASPFVGLANVNKLLLNPLLVIAIRNTLLLALLQFAVTLPLALLLATCLVNLRRGTVVYQGAIFLPVVVSLVAVSLLFRMLMDPDIGMFNQTLRALGLPTSRWLSAADSALPTVAAIDIWKGLGFYVMLLTAGLLNIPSDLHDAARVDGATAWQHFRHITLPLLGHTLALVMVILAIGSLQVYVGPFVLTSGGPANATYVYNMLIVDEAFTHFRFGAASVAALLQFLVVFIISVIQLKLIRPKWSY